jgi:hypothetical protein
MNWRRVAEVLRLREAVRLMDERDAYDDQLDREQAELEDLTEATLRQTTAAKVMKDQARLGSYGRIRIDR